MPSPIYVILTAEGAVEPNSAQRLLSQFSAHTNVEFRPLHPGVNATELSRFYVSNNVDDDTAVRVIEQLRRAPGIEAAYTKPRDEPP